MKIEYLVIAVAILFIFAVVFVANQSATLPDLGTEPGVTTERRAVEDFTGLDALAFQGLGTDVVGTCHAVVPESSIGNNSDGKHWILDEILTAQSMLCIDRLPSAGYVDIYIGSGPLVYYLIAYRGDIDEFGPVLKWKVKLVASGPTRDLGMIDNHSIYVIAKEDK